MRTAIVIPALKQLDRSDSSSPVYRTKDGIFYSIWQGDDWKFFSQILVRISRDKFSLELEEEDTREQLSLGRYNNPIVCASLYSYASFFQSMERNVKIGITNLLFDLRTRLSNVTEENLTEVCSWIVQLNTDLVEYKTQTFTMNELRDELVLLIDSCSTEDFLNPR